MVSAHQVSADSIVRRACIDGVIDFLSSAWRRLISTFPPCPRAFKEYDHPFNRTPCKIPTNPTWAPDPKVWK